MREHRALPRRAASVAAVVVATLVLVPAGPAGAAETLTIGSATAGETAVKGGQELALRGTVPTGGAGAVLLEALAADGRILGDVEVNGAVLRPEQPQGDYVAVSGNDVKGRLTLTSLFSGPGAFGAPTEDVRAVRVVLCAGDGGQESVAACRGVRSATRTTSNPYRVDYTRPFVRGYELIAPDRIRVVFSEPVQHPQGESALDWQVTQPSRVVTQVQGPLPNDCQGRYLPGEDAAAGPTGCTRTLVLSQPVGEDEQPHVTYSNAPAPDRYRHDDFNRNTAEGANPGASSDAVDKVLPALPSIQKVAEDATTQESPRAESNVRSPQVVLGNLVQGQEVLVRATPTGAGRGAETAWTPVTGSSMTVTLPPLVGEGEQAEFTLLALARDDAGNVSSGNNDGSRVDGTPNPVTYLADAVPPTLLSAASTDGTSLTVTFSEPVTGTNAREDWTYRLPGGGTSMPTDVTGTGAERRLTPTAPDGTTLVYQPVASSTPYRDTRSNLLAVPATVPVSSVGAPVVELPAALLHTRSDSVTLSGTSAAGTVEVLRDTDADGKPDGAALASAPASAGRFSVPVPLPADGAYDLFVVLVTDKGRSAPARAPRVVRDTAPPVVDLQAPAGGEVFAGGSTQQVRYSATDANPQTVRIEASYDDGRTFELLTASSGGSPYAWTTPKRDSERTRVRVTSTDLAGNSTPDVSLPFVLDATPPSFSAVTVDARTVLVRLSEAVAGSSSALDWRVKGERVSQASQTTEGGRPVVRLTTGPGVTIGPDEEPVVTYEPSALSQQYQDRAKQVVARRQVPALDGILPAVPTVTAPAEPVLTKDAAYRAAGRGTVGDRVELLDPFGARVAGPVAVGPDGTWTVDAPLGRDSVNDLRARALDTHQNASAAAPVSRIEQDGTDPAVTVTEPRSGTRVEPGQQVTVRWTSTDRNLVDGQTLVQASTDGGETYTTVAEQQPASGSTTWAVPDTVTPRALLKVSTPDRAGRTGSGRSGLLGIGTAAASSPSPSASPSGSATPGPSLPPVGPVTVSVPPATITPGQKVDVTVQGDPGTRVELQAYSRPSTRYVRVRTGTLGPDGRLVLPVGPGTNTRLFARPLGGDDSTSSRSVVIGVRTALSLTVVRNGRRDYTFQGRVLPRRAGQLITLYRVTADGRRVITTQIQTDSTGTYRIRRVFTGSGRFGFLTRTGQNLNNAAGESNAGKARPTEVY